MSTIGQIRPRTDDENEDIRVTRNKLNEVINELNRLNSVVQVQETKIQRLERELKNL